MVRISVAVTANGLPSFQTEPLRAVGFGEMALSLQKAGIKHSFMLDAVK